MKKIWLWITAALALAAGALIYNGGKLIIIYHDYRHGSLILVAGLAVGLLYAGSIGLWAWLKKKP